MKKERKKQNKKEKEECPLCKISEDTIERLKKEKEEKSSKELESPTKRKSSWKFKVWLLIFVFAAVGFVSYQFSSSPSPQLTGEENLEQLEEKNQASTWDIFSGGLKVGDLAPNFVAQDPYGNKVSLSDFQDKKPVLLVFWATWCGYCAKELPDLKDFTEQYQNEIQVIVVSSGESKETIKNYIQEKNVNFLMLLDENRTIWNTYLIRGTPSHFLISSQREIVTLRPGLASREDLEIMMTMLTELW